MIALSIRLIQGQTRNGMVFFLQPKLEQLGFLGGECGGVKKEEKGRRTGKILGLPLSEKKANINLERLNYHSSSLRPVSNLAVQ